MTSTDRPVFRFAPSPNGELHLGHAYSALINHAMARVNGGQFLLRLEDIDQERCTWAFERQIMEDLVFLGVDWDGEQVTFVIGIAGKGDEHLEILSQIAILFSEEDDVARLKTLQTPEEIYAVVSEATGS